MSGGKPAGLDIPALATAVLAAAEAAHIGVTVVRETEPNVFERVFVNRAVMRIFGYDSEEEMLALPALAFYTPEDAARIVSMNTARLQGRPSPPTLELQGRRKDGSAVPVEVAYSMVRVDDRQITVSFVRDVTERARMQARLIASDRMATIGALAASVAHEINNPLAYVLLNLGFLERELPTIVPGADQAERLGTMLRSCLEGTQRVATIVRDLRILAQAQADEQRPVDLVQALEAALDLAERDLSARARVVSDYQVRPKVRGSSARLGQVFLNLLLNAAQAIEEGRAENNEVRVVVRADEDAVLVEIKDTGCGIPRELMGRVFEPFFTTKPAELATGLGLTICERVLRGMNGSLTVESTAGEGSTFRVRLPVVE